MLRTSLRPRVLSTSMIRSNLVINTFGAHSSNQLLRLKIHNLRSLSTQPTSATPEIDGLWAKAKALGNQYVLGSKQLWRNFKESQAIRKRVRENPAVPLTRREYRLVVRNATDMRAGIPFVMLFFTPIIGYFVMFLAPLFPRYLPSTFWNAKQLARFWREDSAQRPYLLESLKEINSFTERLAEADDNKTLIQACRDFTALIDKSLAGHSVTNAELSSFAQHFKTGDMGIDRDDPHARRHLEVALAYLNQGFFLSKVLPFSGLQEQVRRFINFITADDQLIMAEGGPTKLSTEELQVACHERGLPCEGLTREQLIDLLTDWIELTTSHASPALKQAQQQGKLFPQPVNRHKALFPFPPAVSCSSIPAKLLLHAGALKYGRGPSVAATVSQTQNPVTPSSASVAMPTESNKAKVSVESAVNKPKTVSATPAGSSASKSASTAAV